MKLDILIFSLLFTVINCAPRYEKSVIDEIKNITMCLNKELVHLRERFQARRSLHFHDNAEYYKEVSSLRDDIMTYNELIKNATSKSIIKHTSENITYWKNQLSESEKEFKEVKEKLDQADAEISKLSSDFDENTKSLVHEADNKLDQFVMKNLKWIQWNWTIQELPSHSVAFGNDSFIIRGLFEGVLYYGKFFPSIKSAVVYNGKTGLKLHEWIISNIFAHYMEFLTLENSTWSETSESNAIQHIVPLCKGLIQKNYEFGMLDVEENCRDVSEGGKIVHLYQVLNTSQ